MYSNHYSSALFQVVAGMWHCFYRRLLWFIAALPTLCHLPPPFPLFLPLQNGTDVVGCQLTPDNTQVVVKKLHNVNHTNALDSETTVVSTVFFSNALFYWNTKSNCMFCHGSILNQPGFTKEGLPISHTLWASSHWNSKYRFFCLLVASVLFTFIRAPGSRIEIN